MENLKREKNQQSVHWGGKTFVKFELSRCNKQSAFDRNRDWLCDRTVISV